MPSGEEPSDLPGLSLRELNRATLARQHLLERTTLGAADLVEHLVGLQSQTPQTWYVGFWCRLVGFRAEDASDLLARRELVRLALMRSTIHLVTARDALGIRPLVAPVIERSTMGAFGRRLDGVDRTALAAAGREVLQAEPMIFASLGRRLAEQFEGRDPDALAQGVRSSEALVQVTPRGLWGRSGQSAHTTLRAWLGDEVVDAARPLGLEELVLRYLAAFGPATVKDVQTWSGLTRLAAVVDGLGNRLVAFTDDVGRVLYDLPEAPRPPAETPVPVRYLYDFDNLVLSHADRRRVVTDAYLQWVDPKSNVMPRLVLVDGFTAGTWTVEREGRAVVLHVRAFDRFPARHRGELLEEGESLLQFLEPDADHDVRLAAH